MVRSPCLSGAGVHVDGKTKSDRRQDGHPVQRVVHRHRLQCQVRSEASGDRVAEEQSTCEREAEWK